MEIKRPFVERRKSHRVEARVPVQLEEREEGAKGKVIPAESANLSEGGVYCEIGKYLPPLTKVALTLLLPSFGGKQAKPLEIKAEAIVVRTLPERERRRIVKCRIACAFTSITDEQRAIVREYIIWRLLGGLRKSV